MEKNLHSNKNSCNFALANETKTSAQRRAKIQQESESRMSGEMAEWSIAAVLKTVEGNTSGGSNPSLSSKSSLISCNSTS